MGEINFDLFRFQVSSGFDDKDVFTYFLGDILIATPASQKLHCSCSGVVRLPSHDAKCMNVSKGMDRAVKFSQILDYIDKNVAFSTYEYTKIEYTGNTTNEWISFEKVLMDFIDYIIPYINKLTSNEVNIQNVIFVDNTQKKNSPITFHVLGVSKTPHEFYGLWQRYVDVLKSDYQDRIQYKD